MVQENNNNKIPYLMSAIAGSVLGAFTMVIFMFNLVASQAELRAKLDSHLIEWEKFRDDFIESKRDGVKEHRELLEMIYGIRGEIHDTRDKEQAQGATR